MVALTATMHACMPNVLSGVSNQINTMTIANDVAEMFAYSGNASSGKGFRTSLEVADGAMFLFVPYWLLNANKASFMACLLYTSYFTLKVSSKSVIAFQT